MDRLLSMRAFVRVVDEQSFAAAARSLEAAPTAVTRLVADLEANLGVRLLHRSTRHLALTDAGEQYLGRVRAILADIEEAESQAAGSSLQPSGRVRVLMPPGFSFHQLARHLPRFLDGYPDVAIDLANTSLIDMADAAYDVSILLAVGELTHGGFVAHRLATSHVVLCASPAYLARQGAPQSPADMSAHRSLAVTVPGAARSLSLSLFRNAASGARNTASDRQDAANGGRNAAGGGGDAVEIHPPNVLAAQHADTLLAAAIAGVGIAGLPSFMLQDSLASGALVRVLPDWHLAKLAVYAAVPTRKYLPMRVRAFTDFLIATFRAEGDPWLGAATSESETSGDR